MALPYCSVDVDSIAWKPSSWMYDLRNFIGHQSLTSVRLIGAHNAGTSNIHHTSAYAADAPRVLRDRNPGYLKRLLLKAANAVTSDWAKTQNLSVLEQLHYGVRYFDFRVAPHRTAEGDQLYITHGLCSVRLSTVIEQIADFYREEEHRNEVIVVDFQTITDLTSAASVEQLYTSLQPIESLLSRSSTVHQLTLNEIWAHHTCRILVLLGNLVHRQPLDNPVSFSTAPRPQYFHRREEVLHSPWMKCDKVHSLLSSIQKESIQPHAAAESPKLQVIQAVLTPKVSSILTGLVSPFEGTPRNVRGYAESLNAVILDWFRSTNLSGMKHPRRSNILMLDFVEVGRCDWRCNKKGPEGSVLTKKVNGVELCCFLNIVAGMASASYHTSQAR